MLKIYSTFCTCRFQNHFKCVDYLFVLFSLQTQAPPQAIPLIPSSQPPAPPHPRQPTYSPFPPPNVYSPFGMPYVRPPVMMGTRGTGPPPPMHPSHPAHAVPIPTQPMETAFRPLEQSHTSMRMSSNYIYMYISQS